MPQKKKSKRGKRGQQRRPNATASPVLPATTGEPDMSAQLVDKWSATRGGAWASRGFDFQHTVAVWLAARLIAGDLQADGLVPEGLEDITIEAEACRHVQVKSRGEHLGTFPLGTASSHIVDAWLRHLDRGAESDNLTVVFERGVEGEPDLTTFETPLSESLGADSKLRTSIVAEVTKRGLKENDGQVLLERTAVCGISWASLDQNGIAQLGTAFDRLPPAALDYLARELRVVMAETARLNASAEYLNRHALSRSELMQRSQHFVEQVDLDALEAAVKLGLCSPLSLAEPMHDERFYEGVATQPGHVAAGLVVPRTDLVGEAVSGLQGTSSVILTGPSGVGKSAVLWSIPHALPGVLWFRVNRLLPADVPEVLRLCRSYRVSDANPIGLLVDAAGTEPFDGWPLLRDEAAATPGLFVISTARHEDLISLGDLSGCATITVALDENAAEAIFVGLRERNATDAPHWREAFDQADGLTLEFTHILTRGRRLNSVIADQIRRRIAEKRNVELDLLSLSATADRWSATLPVGKAAEACGVSQLDLRHPLARLADEHLLVERNGTISGVHQLRSEAISNAIHDRPPPTLDYTVERLLPALVPEQVRRFIPNALRDEPQLDRLIRDAALKERNGAVELAAYLRGLRLSDFYDRAVSWAGIAERQGVPPADQPVAQFLAIAGTDLPNFFREELRQAIEDMRATPEPARASALISEIGAQRLAETLATTDDIGLANGLMFELQRSEIDIAKECRSAFTPTSPLVAAIRSAPIEQVADILATASLLDGSLAQALIESSGGEPVIVAKIRAANPWITDIQIDDDIEDGVAYARILHISDAVHGDPHDRVVALGRLLLRCFPRTACVDVKVLLPGGHDYQIGGYQLGSTNLVREHDHSELEMAWNQERMRVTNAVLGATDTERLASALPMIDAAAELTPIIGGAFAAADVRHIDTNQLADRINALDKQARQIRPRLNNRSHLLDAGGNQDSAPLMADPLSGLIMDLTDNVFPRLTKLDNPAALAAHLSDHVIAKSLHRTQDEPWHVLGHDPFPASLASLEVDLNRLLAVVSALATDPTASQRLVRAARAGGHQGALGRAADTARSLTKRRLQARKAELEQVGKDIGWRFRVHMPRDDRYQLVPERLVALDIPSLTVWSNALEETVVALKEAGLSGEKFVVVPIRNGRPVEPLTVSLSSSLLPTGELGHWASELPDGHETPLTAAFDAAIASLQVASGVLALPELSRSHDEVAQIMREARQEFARSRQIVDSALRDSVTEQITLFLDALDEALTREETGESVGGSIASQLLLVATQGIQTELTRALAAVRLMALEWDIDRDAAARLLESS